MKALIIGGTGFLGSHLAGRIKDPVIAGRNAEKIKKIFGEVRTRVWNGTGHTDHDFFKGVDTVFHLAGESIFSGRWNEDKKKRIRSSRVESTRKLVDSIKTSDFKPGTLVCGSAIGFYGSRDEEILSEQSSAGEDFLAQVCADWEREAMRGEELGMRVVCVRTGIVLGPGGGALAQMLPIFKLGLGGRLGSGKQYMSWIHVDDLTGIMLHAAENSELSGPVNGVAPTPVANSDFTKILANVLNRPALFPVPAFALKLAVGEFADVLLGSQRVTPEKILNSGYIYQWPELYGALYDLLGSKS